MNRFPRLFALFLTLASACAWAQAPAAPPVPVKEENRLPKLELTEQILYQFLLAEIAAQRGQFGFRPAHISTWQRARAICELCVARRKLRFMRDSTMPRWKPPAFG
ncbi:MAG: hypothetical protein M0Q22_11785 [Sulfuritalea sp.]|jgi:hypothetical protein|nr:hypothetical protein [Sulfuritalea sp.]